MPFPVGSATALPILPMATASLQALMGTDLRATAAITASVAPMSAGLRQMALAASVVARFDAAGLAMTARPACLGACPLSGMQPRSEDHTSEPQPPLRSPDAVF